MRRPLWVRLFSGFLLWTAARAVYFVYRGDADPDFRMANENG